jgi:ABC-type nitrate/sulfonate/bicarbonate transport system substrate-binding protein
MNWRILWASIAMMVFNLGASAAIGQEKIKFPVGVGTKTVGTHMFWLGVKKGFFDEVGLDVQPILLRGTTITIQALASESLYLALGSANFTLGTAASSADLVAVSGGVGGLTSGATNVFKRILKQNGLE